MGDVTWLLDDSYYDKSTSTPHEMLIETSVGQHKLKARWNLAEGSTGEVVAHFTVGPYLTHEQLPLSDAHVASPLTVHLANADAVTGEVTWLVDGEYAGKDAAAPYEWRVAASLGQHTLKARWVVSGTTTAETTSSFTVETDLDWAAPATVYEEPAPALRGLWLTADNRRQPVPGVYDWSRAGFGGGTILPSDANVRSEDTCRIDPAEMSGTFGVVPNDGADDTAGIQAAIDHIKAQCSPTGEYTSVSRILLPAGTLNVSAEIHVDADYLIIRGAGSDPATGTHIVYSPNESTRYDTITEDGTRWDLDAMSFEEASGGWLWPGRGLFRVQSREVAPQYADSYAAAPENRKDLFEGTINAHWTTGLTLRGKDGDPGFSARAGDNVIHLAANASFDNLNVGGLVSVMAANSIKFYEEMEALPTEHDLENLHMRQQLFMVTAGDPFTKTITLDKPLEFDLPVNSTSDGSEPINGEVFDSKLSPLVDAVVGVGFENLSFTQAEPGLDPDRARANYGNMDPAAAMHGIVFKWAANSWVKGVRAQMTGSHPIVTETAANLSIIDNYLDGAWNKGKGGNGYLRGSRVYDSLYAGNTIRNLRHFTFQWSSSGNVAIGNSLDADLNLHGGYERNNLFELNEVSVPHSHRPDSCWTNCGGEGGSAVDDADWYPIWWGAGQKAVKWSGSTGPNNVFFNNFLRKQTGNETNAYSDYEQYGDPQTIYQFGLDSDGDFQHLDVAGTPIADWAGSETQDFTGGHGIVDTRSDSGRSLFLIAPTLDGYGGPTPQELRRTWGCSCWDGRGMVNTRLAADPINTATGSLMETFTDLSLAGVGESLVWTRTYNSLDPTPGPLGTGWTFGYNASVSHDSDGYYYVRDGTGSVTRYQKEAGGTYVSTDPGVTATFSDAVGGGWTLTNLTGGSMQFNADGQLIALTDDRELGLTLAYTSGRLASITDELGQTFTVIWAVIGESTRIKYVQAADGLQIEYGYANTAGELRLTSVTGIDGRTTAYTYDTATGHLNSITDPEGNVSARTVYDPITGRAISQRDANGGETTFEWDEETQTATITDPKGNVRRDVYQGNVLIAQIDDNGRADDVYYNDENHPIAQTSTAQQIELTEYDSAGNLIKRTLAASPTRPQPLVETWTYDSENRLISHTDFVGGVITHTYDSAGNRTSTADPTGAVRSWTYNSLGQPLTETDPLGNVTTMGYDTAGNLISVASPTGELITYEYDLSHNRVAQTDPRGNVPNATAEQKEKYTTHWTYDVFGRVLTVTDPLDHVTTNEYDDLGRLVKLTSPSGGETTNTYDNNGSALTVTDAYGKVTANTYDEAGNLVATVAPDGATTTWEYNDLNQMVASTDPVGNADGTTAETKHAHTTTYAYDAAGNQTIVRVPDPADPARYLATRTTYDDQSRPIAVVDSTGAVSTTTYDSLGRITSTIDPTGVTQQHTYDPVGRELTRAAGGTTISNEYDPAGRLIKSTTDSGATTTYEYDAAGRLIKTVEPRGSTPGATPDDYATTYTYDANGNRVTETNPLGRTTTTEYNGLNNVTQVTNAAGHDTHYGYNSAGQVNKVTDPRNDITLYSYDKIGQLKTVTNPEGGETSYSYDDAGRLTSTTTPGGQTTGYTYNANGNLLTTALPDGTITYTYDALNRRTGTDYSDDTPDLTTQYDAGGRVTSNSNGTSTSEYSYDLAGRVTEIRRGNQIFDYVWDEHGRLTERHYPDGRTQTYSWGIDALLTDTTMSMGSVNETASYTYDPAGQLLSTARSNGPTTTREYDPAGQLTALDTTQGSTVVTTQDISWNTAGQPRLVSTMQYGSTRSVVYGYDDAGQVSSVCSPTSGTTCGTSSPKVTYTYDGNGNRLTTTDTAAGTTATYAYDANDRLTSGVTQGAGTSETTTYSYGPNGDLSSQTGPDGTRTFTYGLDGNLYTLALEDGTNVTYSYDDAGNRTSQTTGPTTTRWVWDTQGAQPFRANESGPTYHRWFDDPQSTLGTATAGFSGSAVATWLLNDFQGSITGTIRTAGLTGTAKYGAFGEEAGISGSMASQPLRYHGQYLDSASGLYDMRLRDYDASTGRFTNIDPMPVSAGVPFAQTYHYAYNQPTLLNDPSGACPWCISAIVGGVLGAAIGGVSAAVTGGDVWAGVGAGALTGALVGAVGGAGFAVAASLGLGAVGGWTAGLGVSAGANVAAGWAHAAITGREWTGQDALIDGATGLIPGGGGIAARTLAPSVLKNRAWIQANSPAPLPKGKEQIYACAPGAGSTSPAANMARVREMGRQGELAAGIKKNTRRIESEFGTAKYRTPDELNHGVIGEVKNTSHLRYTPQLRDYAAHSQKYDKTFNLYVRQNGGTKLSPDLQEAVDQGKVVVNEVIPW